jgi:hypothetical protein
MDLAAAAARPAVAGEELARGRGAPLIFGVGLVALPKLAKVGQVALR